MALELKLTAERTEMLLQELTEMKVLLRNTGPGKAEVIDINRSTENPIFRVQQLSTGELRTFRRPSPPGLFGNPLITMAPGQEQNYVFDSHEVLSFPEPGEYVVTAEVEPIPGEPHLVSNPLTLTLLPMTALRMQLGMTQEPNTPEFYVFWTRQAAGSIELMRSLVSNHKKPRVIETIVAMPLPGQVEFLPSICANRGNPLHTWISYLHGEQLVSRLVEMDAVESSPIITDLPARVRIKLIAHPLITELGVGESVLWLASRGGESAKLQLAVATPEGGSHAGGDVLLDQPAEPLWAQTAYLTAGERRAYLLHRLNDQLHLRHVSWKDPASLNPPAKLLQTPGFYVAAGLAALEDDSIAGVLVARPNDDDHALLVHAWRHQADGTFSSAEPVRLFFENAHKIDSSLVRLDYRGEAYIALRPAGSNWLFRHPEEEFAELTGVPGESAAPLALFFNKFQEPLFIAPLPNTGFEFFDARGLIAGSARRA